MSRFWISLLLSLGWFGGARVLAVTPTTDLSRNTDSFAGAAASLSDPSPQKREEAALLLWNAGPEAEPALEEAARSDDPEVANRARGILERIHFGLSPQSPPELFKLLSQYRGGSEPLKQGAVNALSSVPGGLRVVVGLLAKTRDEAMRQIIIGALQEHAHEAAALLLGDGNRAATEEVLAGASGRAVPAADRDFAAFEFLSGGLQAKTGEIRAQVEKTNDQAAAIRLLFFCRAAGDLASARRAAEKCSSDELLDGVLTDQAEWAAMAQRLKARVDRDVSIHDLGYLAAFQRLSGDLPGLARTAEAIVAFGDAHPEKPQIIYCAQALFLNDRPDEAIGMLLKHREFLAVADYLAPRLMLSQAMQLPQLGAGAERKVLLSLRGRAAAAGRFVGDQHRAQEDLAQVAKEARPLNDTALWAALSSAAREIGDEDQSTEYLADAMAATGPSESVTELLQLGGVGDAALAARWWNFLRQARGGLDLLPAAQRVLRLIGPHAAAGEVAELAVEIKARSRFLPPAGRALLLSLSADTFAAAGMLGDAEAIDARLVNDQPDAQFIQALAEIQFKRGEWKMAAASYRRAWELDRPQPGPLFLAGLALQRAGDEPEGKRLMELAHWLPLGSDAARHGLLEVCASHHCDDDVRRERDFILRVGDFSSWERSDALRGAGDEANGNKQYALAAGLWDRAFLDNLSTRWAFLDPWANVKIPALIARTRALGCLASGEFDKAQQQAAVCFHDAPGDADEVIELTNAFRDAGRSAAADDLFGKAVAVYGKLCADFPSSGPAHNLLAWVEARTNRKLDDAIEHARRAVQLEPANTASLDTLAEALFQHGDLKEAIATINKCIDLEPQEPHHRKQMERFREALAKRNR